MTRLFSRWTRWLVGASVLVALLAGAAMAQDGGVLTGQVQNGTEGGPQVGAGLPVNLRVFRGEAEVGTFATDTDAEGSFVFEGLDTDPALVYVPEAVYLGIVYPSAKPFSFEGQADLDTVLTVFETTEDDGAVHLDSVHLIAESFGQMLRISEIHLFGNSTDRTYVGESSPTDGSQPITVFIPQPEEAVGLAFQGDSAGERYVETDGGVLDTEPVVPGTESSLAFFSYHLVVAGDSVPVERRFAYPVSNLSLLVTQPGLELHSDQLDSMGPQMFEGKQYELYATSNLAADAPLSLEFIPGPGAASGSGMPAPAVAAPGASTGASRSSQGTLLWLGIGLAVLALVGVVVYAATVGRSPGRSGSSPVLTRKPESRRLLAELADLEEAFAGGQIDEASYESQRAEKCDALRALWE